MSHDVVFNNVCVSLVDDTELPEHLVRADATTSWASASAPEASEEVQGLRAALRATCQLACAQRQLLVSGGATEDRQKLRAIQQSLRGTVAHVSCDVPCDLLRLLNELSEELPAPYDSEDTQRVPVIQHSGEIPQEPQHEFQSQSVLAQAGAPSAGPFSTSGSSCTSPGGCSQHPARPPAVVRLEPRVTAGASCLQATTLSVPCGTAESPRSMPWQPFGYGPRALPCALQTPSSCAVDHKAAVPRADVLPVNETVPKPSGMTVQPTGPFRAIAPASPSSTSLFHQSMCVPLMSATSAPSSEPAVPSTAQQDPPHGPVSQPFLGALNPEPPTSWSWPDMRRTPRPCTQGCDSGSNLEPASASGQQQRNCHDEETAQPSSAVKNARQQSSGRYPEMQIPTPPRMQGCDSWPNPAAGASARQQRSSHDELAQPVHPAPEQPQTSGSKMYGSSWSCEETGPGCLPYGGGCVPFQETPKAAPRAADRTCSSARFPLPSSTPASDATARTPTVLQTGDSGLVLPGEELELGVQRFISRIEADSSLPWRGTMPPECREYAAKDAARFPWIPDLLKLLRENFGHQEFRGLQLPVINAILTGRDVFAVLPTGAGKSCCFQIPALHRSGVVVVVSPLLSLMHDQVRGLQQKGIAADRLGSDTKADEAQTFEELAAGRLDLLYLSPERIVGSSENRARLFKALTVLHKAKLLPFFVIDEAHCVSQWGIDFRKQYRELRCLRKNFPGVPILALTASATQRVEADVISSLAMNQPVKIHDTFDRPNLFMEVRPKVSEKQVLDEVVALARASSSRGRPACGIVYALSREDTIRFAKSLSEQDVKAMPYHAGLASGKKHKAFDSWMNGACQVVVATVAFGMGIDKRDVRFVCHLSMPSAVERYHQEIGRAGRDGGPCRCVLWYSLADVKRLKRMTRKAHEIRDIDSAAALFGDTARCRRACLLEHFGERPASVTCAACDVCLRRELYGSAPVPKEEDFQQEAQHILSLADALKGHNMTAARLRDAAKGRKQASSSAAGQCSADVAASHASFGKLSSQSLEVIEMLIRKLVELRVLEEQRHALRGRFRSFMQLRIGRDAAKLRAGQLRVCLPVTAPGRTDSAGVAPTAHSEPGCPSTQGKKRKPSGMEDAPPCKGRRTTANTTKARPHTDMGHQAQGTEGQVVAQPAVVSDLLELWDQSPQASEKPQLPSEDVLCPEQSIFDIPGFDVDSSGDELVSVGGF